MSLLKEETLAKKLITKGSLAYIFAFLIAPTGYLARVIVSNTLSVEDIGIFYSIIGLIGILAAYNDLGLTEALQYYLPKYWIEKKYNEYKTIRFFTCFMQLLTGVCIGLAIWFGSDWLAVHYFHAPEALHILKVFSIYFVAINFLQALGSFYTAFQDVLSDKIVEAIRMYSILIFTMIFWLTQSISLQTYSYAWLLGLAVGLVVSIFFFIKKYAHTLHVGHIFLESKTIKTQITYAFWVFLGMNAATLLGQVDQQMIITILGPKYAGYYTNYLSLFTLYSVFAFPLLSLLFPIITELITKKQTQKITHLLAILYKYFSLLGIAIGGLFVVLGPVIASVLYGSSFEYSGVLLRYAAAFIVFNILLGINFSIMAGMGKVKQRVIILAVALGVNILGNLFFIITLGWGLVGALIATVIGRILMFLLTFYTINREYRIRFDWQFFVKNIIIVALLNYIILQWVGLYDRSIATAFLVRIMYLALISISYIAVLLLCNYRSITAFIAEIKNIIPQKQKGN